MFLGWITGMHPPGKILRCVTAGQVVLFTYFAYSYLLAYLLLLLLTYSHSYLLTLTLTHSLYACLLLTYFTHTRGQVLLHKLRAHVAGYHAMKRAPGGSKLSVGLVHHHITFVASGPRLLRGLARCVVRPFVRVVVLISRAAARA